MKKLYNSKLRLAILSCLLLCTSGIITGAQAQSFSQNNINFNGKGSVSAGTSLMFGPDGRLYVAEYTGKIKIFTVERQGPGNYVVLSTEVLDHIQQIQDHNDNGTNYTSTNRETIGLTMAGTASNPVIYVTSSDFRIGGGGGGGSGDIGLDTNSGVITRFSWNGSSWDVVDIVRGLPRSEENHATNGLEFVTVNGINYLIVAQGGHTNGGGPSQNFAYTTEYALSAAILSVNLTQLNSMPILDDNGRKYIYDIPTMDDPTRPNANGITDPDNPGYNGIDVNDPFGGNDGLNQAIIVPGGPVQIFSPGYRNAYDLVVTENDAVYVTDNGANGGWGGFPVNEGGGLANNDYDPMEPGSSFTSDGEKVNNKDHLSLVTLDIQNYTFGSFYGGHPTPVRANPFGAGIYTNPAVTGTEGAVFRTKIYHPNNSSDGFTTDPGLGLPANWPPVKSANPVEGDYRGPEVANPDGPIDALVTTWDTNTNGIDEYSATNFNGAMKGDLIAGVNTGELRRVELNENGSLKNLTPSFASGLGGNALGIACNSDSDIFPGTIWVVTLNGKLVVLEPQDFGNCLEPGGTGYDPTADYDFDGYTNQDEEDNGTDPCNGASQPSDFDKSTGGILISDLNDLDDDNDGILDSADPFQLGDPHQGGSDAFEFPVINELFSSNPELKGYMGLGMTGLMNNADPNPNWLNWLDRRDDPNDPNPNDILGGAIGAMTMQMTSGTALGSNNSQEKGFQYGVQVDQATGEFTVAGNLVNFNGPLQLYGNSGAPNGELGFFIGDGTQNNYIKFVITQAGFIVQQELNDVPSTPQYYNIATAERPNSGVIFYFNVDPSNGEISLEYSFDNGFRIPLGTVNAQGAILNALQQAGADLAVGFIGTSNAAGVEVEGTWDFLNVTSGKPTIVQDLPDLERTVGASDEVIDLNEYFYDDNGVENLNYTVEGNTNSAIGAGISNNILTLNFPISPATSDITIRATDANLNFVEQTFTVSINEEPTSLVLYRVNAGGPAITAIDGELDWGVDTSTEKSIFLSEAGSNKSYSGTISSYTDEVDQSTTPVSIFGSERYDDKAGAPNLTYSFPVPEVGFYEIRLYMGNGWSGTAQVGERIFDVEIEGMIHTDLDDLDLSATFGHNVGAVITKTIEVTDGSIDISFIHGIQNPLINGIEILGTSGVDIPIQVAEIPNQDHINGEELDGSLVVSATGGDGNLSYSISGQPVGVSIEPTNGQIGGTIDMEADVGSPYTVTVSVDDSDDQTIDAVTTNFTWTVTTGEPVILVVLPDLQRSIGAADEDIDLDGYFYDNNGVENLTYTVEGNTNPAIGAIVSGSILSISYPIEPAVSDITIRATDADLKIVEQTFTVAVNEEPTSLVLYRVNSGGPAITSIDEEMDWAVDTPAENSPYLSEPGNNKTYSGSVSTYSNEVDQTTTPVSIFGSERYDSQPGAPNLTYSFPVTEPGNYELRLYMGNGYSGTSEPGQRVFDVAIEGIIYADLDDLDLSATYGHKVGAVITKTIEVTDGAIDVSFIHGIENPLINGIEILSSSGVDIPIHVAGIPNQDHINGEELDGSLVVSATGGDGNLSYSISGQPAGVSIEPSNGQIGGTIDMEADVGSPYTVTVSVDDSDDQTIDAVTTNFTWTVTTGEPVILVVLPDLQRSIGAADEDIDLDGYFYDNNGVENLTYTVEGNTNPAIGAIVSGSILSISYPIEPAVSDITIRATDADLKIVEQTFTVAVNEEPTSLVLYRVNSGGPAITSIDEEMDWAVDTPAENSPYLSEPGNNKTYSGSVSTYSNEVDQTTTPVSIFGSERYDSQPGAPNLTYSFPVTEPGNYELRLYMGNGYSGTSEPGQRVFDVAIEGIIYADLDDLDLSATYGHKVGAVITKTIEVTDGAIDVSFIHGIENPLINGIEILSSSGVDIPIHVAGIPNQNNINGEELDGSLVVSATGGDGDLIYAMTGAPAGVNINPLNGQISGLIDPEAEILSPYSVIVTVDDSDEESNDAVTVNFTWFISAEQQFKTWVNKDENENYTARHECSFVQAGNRFYLIGGRENAKTVDIYDYTSNSWTSLIDSAPYEFNHYQATEYQGLIWIIGAFKTNSYPSELSAEFIWAFDPSSQEWIQGPEIPAYRQRGSAGLVIYKDKFYITGGNTNGHNGGYVSWFDEYDPATGTWTPLTDAPRARDHFHSAVIGDKLYAVGGRLSGGDGGTFKPVIAEVDVYDFNSASWSTLPASKNLPTPRAAASVVNFNDKLVVIGGEVLNELVYGVVTDDALKITEEYDPGTGTWSRLGDLNFERQGTQAIVSGNGIFTLAGSANRGGGRQKNMEYMGVDAPVGDPAIASTISVPDNVQITAGVSADIDLKIDFGNVGIIITSMEISGTDMDDFIITSGQLSQGLLKPNSIHRVSVDFIGTVAGKTALLNINYGETGQSSIVLESTGDMPIQVDQIADQANVVGDVLDGSLVVSASGGDGELVYSMTGAPIGVTINSVTGVISGTIDMEADVSSPYSVVIEVDDSDEEINDAVSAVFTWTVTGTPQTLIEISAIADQANVVGDVLDGSLVVSASGGDGELVYSMTGAPIGVTINSVTGVISGTIDMEADVSSPYSVVVSVDDSDDQTEDAISAGFTWTVTGTPQTLIEISAIADQANVVGDVLDGSLVVSASGGDGDLVYSMTGAPIGVTINSVTGVISGTIDMEADVSSPYSVVIEVDDSDEEINDAVSAVFTWTVTEIPQTLIEIAEIADQANVIGDVLDGSLVVSASGGDGDLVYSMTGAPIGVTINSVTGVISGTIDTEADISSPYSVMVSVDDQDEETADAVSAVFTWTVTEIPQTLIEIAEIADQANVIGDVLDGSLVVSASGGDGDLVYSMTGAPIGVTINSVTGVISGTIDMEADVSSPYSVVIEVDDSDEEINDAVSAVFTWTVTEIPQTLIEIAEIADQANVIGDVLDGSLVVSASGGDGDLVYSMTGAPLGVTINSVTGVISGTIDMEADVSSPYSVMVSVDDQDEETADAVSAEFTWSIAKGEPVVMDTMPDLERYIDTADENIDLNAYFDDDKGVENLIYTVESSNTSLGLSIAGNILKIIYPSAPAISDVKIIATDVHNNSVGQSFTVTVMEIPLVLHRVNAGGPAIAAIDDEKDWGADTSIENSIYLTEPGSNTVAGYSMTSYDPEVDLSTSPTDIFTSERSDGTSGPPNMTYSFPVPKSGTYQVRLYFGNGHNGNSREGRQIFDVEIEGVIYPELDDLDLIVTFGHQVGGVISQTIEVVDGFIDISFIHGAKKNPMINGIEIINASATDSPIQVAQIQDQDNISGDEMDGSLTVSASGGDGDLVYSMSGAPSGVIINAVNGSISGIIDTEADLSSPYSVVVRVDDSDGETTDAVSINFTWTVTGASNPIEMAGIPDQVNVAGDEMDGSLVASASGGDGDFVFSMAGAPMGVSINSVTGVISGTIDVDADASSPYNVTVNVDDSDEQSDDIVSTGFIWTVTNISDTSIVVAEIVDQTNVAGDELDGSLAVSASGGDGDLVYFITGAPLGVVINPTTGIISGTIDTEASKSSPYSVMVNVDDSDDQTEDAISTHFTWTISSGEPVIADNIPDMERFTGTADEDIYLDNYFDDNEGVENLTYSIKGNTDPVIGAVILGNVLTINYPSSPAVSDITVSSQDNNLLAVEQTFRVTVVEETAGSLVLYRVNAGGPGIAAIDEEMHWGADNSTENFPYLTEPGSNTVSGYTMTGYHSEVDLTTTPTAIYTNERSDESSGPPNMTYSFPVAQTGFYEIRLYLGTGHPGNSKPGRQIFDVSIEGVIYPELDDIDLAAKFGHQVGGVINKVLEVTDGFIDISFIHGAKKNPLINGIEILHSSQTESGLAATATKSGSLENIKIAEGEEDVVHSKQFDVQIYPNPVVSEAFIKVSDASVDVKEISLYGYSGQLVRTIDAKRAKTGEGLYMINVFGLPDGVYIVKLNNYEYSNLNLRLVVRK